MKTTRKEIRNEIFYPRTAVISVRHNLWLPRLKWPYKRHFASSWRCSIMATENGCVTVGKHHTHPVYDSTFWWQTRRSLSGESRTYDRRKKRMGHFQAIASVPITGSAKAALECLSICLLSRCVVVDSWLVKWVENWNRYFRKVLKENYQKTLFPMIEAWFLIKL